MEDAFSLRRIVQCSNKNLDLVQIECENNLEKYSNITYINLFESAQYVQI